MPSSSTAGVFPFKLATAGYQDGSGATIFADGARGRMFTIAAAGAGARLAEPGRRLAPSEQMSIRFDGRSDLWIEG